MTDGGGGSDHSDLERRAAENIPTKQQMRKWREFLARTNKSKKRQKHEKPNKEEK